MTSFKYFYVFESSEVLMFCDGVNNYIKKKLLSITLLYF